MKKILLIEDDPIVANVYRNKLAVDGYQAEVASDGEAGLKLLGTFKPDLVILDLMLPTISGVEVIRSMRGEEEFAKIPVIVFSNTYLTNLIQEAWRAGANKCLSKANCSPQDFMNVVRQTIGDSGAITSPPTSQTGTANAKNVEAAACTDRNSQSEIRKNFVEALPNTLYYLRLGLKELIKAATPEDRIKQVHELYRRVHVLHSNASLAGGGRIAHLASALEALLKEIHEKPKNINASTIRTVASAVDFLAVLFERGTQPDKPEMLASKILVVDDEAISRRAIVYALEKAKLKSINVEDPNQALELLAENDFDIVFLDVDMPDMTGFELCAKLRAFPHLKQTPVVFVTSLNDFESRTNSTMAGGNDFIAKPFLFIELTVKALIYVMRALLQSQPGALR